MVQNNNNLKSLKGGVIEALVLTLAPLLFWICTKCVLGTSLIVGGLLIFRTIFLKKAQVEEETGKSVNFSKAAKIGMIALLILLISVIMLHLPSHIKGNEDVHSEPEQTQVVSEEEQKEEVAEDDKTEETSKPAVDPNGRQVKGTRTYDAHGAYTNPDGTLKDKITATKEANDPTKNAPKAETTTGKTENNIVDQINAKADEKTEEIIKEAKKHDNKKVENYKSDIVVITTPAKEDNKTEEKKSANPEKDIVEKQEEVKDLPSVENKPEEASISKEVEDDKVVEMDKDELADLFKNVKTEEKSKKAAPKAEEPKAEEVKKVETKTDAVKTEEVVEETIIDSEAKGSVKVEEAVEKVEENNTKNVEVKETVEVKSVESVKVTAIDGYTATVGSTMQFKISGDDVVIDGLDGIDYSFNNGVLSINTGSEATVLTVEASNSVNTVAFDITINGHAQ